MAQKNTTKRNVDLKKELNSMLEDTEYQNKIQEWWFDDTLYNENNSALIRTELKRYYAFIQVYYHENFRNSSTQIEKHLEALIEKIEREERYKTCEGYDQKLMALVLGSAYRRLGQFKAERYQPAEAEQNKAIQYLEKDISLFKQTVPENTVSEEDFVVMLLFLLNKAKYFRDTAEKDTSRMDASYWRAIMLFQEIKRKIEEKYHETQIKGVLARIYVSAWLNIAQIYRFKQEYEPSARECEHLVAFCINSLENEKEKDKIREVVKKLPKVLDISLERKFLVEKFIQEGRNKVDCLFEDYILQALLQLGISYRDRVDFNGSCIGNIWVRRAIGVFLVLGIIDLIKEKGIKACTGQIESALDTLQGLEPYSMNGLEDLVKQIRDLCISVGTSDSSESVLKNEDAKNNLAVCLKKLNHYSDSIKILSDERLKENKFAEYNLYKCYLESNLTKEMEVIHDYCYKEDSDKERPVYVYPEEPEKSNFKWLFLYARYLFAQEKYEEAEKMFSLIKNSKAIQWDSLELKAAYLEAQCQIQRKKYLGAIASLSNIHETLLKLDKENRRSHEIRTEIDLGWCLTVEDRYQEALDVYRELLIYLVWGSLPFIENNSVNKSGLPDDRARLKYTLEKLKENLTPIQEPCDGTNPTYAENWHAVSSSSQKEILHNLYDCWTYLHMKDTQDTQDAEMSDLIEEICLLIENNDIYIQFLKGLRKMNLLKREFDQNDQPIEQNMREEWRKLSEAFGEILRNRPQDTITYSCWAIGKVNYCMELSRQDSEFETQKKQLLLGLVSSTTPITMKSYIEVARIILNRDGDNNFLNISRETKNKEGMELEYAFLELFCHVNLLENGTNQAFMNLMTNQSFHSIELVARAELLAYIVELYGDILRMKAQLRVTYDDLKDFANRKKRSFPDKEDHSQKDIKPIICQYTRLSTLKCILPKISRGVMGENVDTEPKFRMSNAAWMNDASEGAMFKILCENIAQLGEGSGNPNTYVEVIKKYIDSSSDYKSVDEISSYDGDVYIASFSMNQDNFGLWSNYADKEKGCIIGFDQSFFDLVDKNYYSILDDELEENALYRILYVDENKLLRRENGPIVKSFIGDNKTQDMDMIKTCIPNILKKLEKIEEKLQNTDFITPEAAGVVRAFIVGRLNEIRFLFKSVSYEYEEEMRLLRCSQNPKVDDSGTSAVPWLYINVEKKLDNLTVILGSKVELQQVRELSVWAKSTGRVKHVIWSGLNRL